MSKEHEDTAWSLTRNFAETTSMHGISHIAGKRGIFRRCFWVMAVLGGAGVSTYHIWMIAVSFSLREVSTTVSLEFMTNLSFPAVTICNINAYRQSQYTSFLKGQRDKRSPQRYPQKPLNASIPDSEKRNSSIEDSQRRNSSIEDSQRRNSSIEDSQRRNSSIEDSQRRSSSTEDSERRNSSIEDSERRNSSIADSERRSSSTAYSEKPNSGNAANEKDYSFKEWVSQLTREERLEVGHDISDMLLDCVFDGQQCSASNFTKFQNYAHGNCYTFNVAGSDSKYTKDPGPLYGLSLTLYAEEHEYIQSQAIISNGVGFRVAVHSANVMPFPEDEGFVISPGFVNTVAVTKIVTERAAAPYGVCLNYGMDTVAPPNIFTTELDVDGFSEKACILTCIQQKMLQRCRCCDGRYPCTSEALSIMNIDTADFEGVCNHSGLHEASDPCNPEAFSLSNNGLLGCRDECAPNCHDESHLLEISSSYWPPTQKVSSLTQQILQKARQTGTTLDIGEQSTLEEDEVFMRRNTLRLDVFYKQLHYEKIETKPLYDWSRLLSDVGGQAGLWLGFSLLTLGEVLELLLDITISFFRKCLWLKDRVKPLGGKVTDIR